ncbi:MAG TPA: hypothetical protein VHK22_10545 [Gaiellaceae bacterium]|nr:hypothetical protein [Gaiellaceae bacterium]
MMDSTSRTGRDRQIEFPPEQSPDSRVTPVMIGLSILCIVVVVILVVADVDGPFIGPW